MTAYYLARKRLVAPCRVALAAIGAAGIGMCLPAAVTMAQAQTGSGASDAQPLEEIIVTGSIIRRAETATASPITVLSDEQLDIRGINTIADAIQLLPANNAGTVNQSWSSFGFSAGASAVSLRGLTTSASLTTFDGLRMAPYPLGDDGRRNFVDVGAIPESIIERVEILKDGASSTYGADAIAGVVNVITKKEITGLHFNGSAGRSQQGDSDESRLDVTWGKGDLGTDGFNFYINAEMQQSDSVLAKERPKFGSWDWTHICNSSGGCLDNTNPNGPEADGTIGGITYSTQPLARPYDSITGTSLGNYQLINPAGCTASPWLIERNPSDAADIGLTGPVCEDDYFGWLIAVLPKIQRNGLNLRYTAELGDRAEMYVMGNFYKVKTTDAGGTPQIWGGDTAPGGPDDVIVTLGLPILPVYVCDLGINGYVPCDATNGVLNPNNPFAAAGQEAQLRYRAPFSRQWDTDTEQWRVAAGIAGVFGADDEWDYSVDLVSAKVGIDLLRSGYPIPRRILNVVYDGSFNFIDPRQNSQALWDYVMPSVMTHNTSTVDQLQATISRPLFDMSGGEVIGALGIAYREESLNAPSANGPKDDPYDRYLGVNSVSANGSRDVKSVFFEIDAPVAETFNVNLSGRFDDYSTGQSNFSPKIGFQFQPSDMIKLRGTYSEGFRIPSFNEAFGAPTTGYVSTQIDDTTPEGAAFVAAHGGNAYATGTYSYGLTAIGNEDLDPEESKAYTAGIVFEPVDGLSLTLDYWHIKVDGLISGADYSDVLPQYYQNNGNVNIAGITVLPASPDPEYPNALPLIGFIQYPYQNVDSEVASGFDLGANFSHEFGNVLWSSNLELAQLNELTKTIGGEKQEYAGTLSPCDVTSCSGAPDLRATWINSLIWQDLTLALTANYTGSYDNASIDYGGVKGDCEASAWASTYNYDDDTPYKCTHDAYLDFDFTATYDFGEGIQLFANVLNVFDTEPDFDPTSTYYLYGFNPAWELNGWRGRYFRLGLKVDFD